MENLRDRGFTRVSQMVDPLLTIIWGQRWVSKRALDLEEGFHENWKRHIDALFDAHILDCWAERMNLCGLFLPSIITHQSWDTCTLRWLMEMLIPNGGRCCFGNKNAQLNQDYLCDVC